MPAAVNVNPDKVNISVIHGKAYDLTQFLKKHPGGPIIHYAVGRDATELFESYHAMCDMKYVEKVLSNFEVAMPPNLKFHRPDFTWNQESFYNILKKRIKDHFTTTKKSHKAPWFKWARCWFLFITLLSLLPKFYNGVWWTLPFIGVIMFWCGVLCLHSSTHCSFSPKPLINNCLGVFSCACGSMHPIVWTHSHIIGHHLYPNIQGFDIDSNYAERAGAWIRPWWLRCFITSLIAVFYPTFIEGMWFRYRRAWPAYDWEVKHNDDGCFDNVRLHSCIKWWHFIPGDIGHCVYFYLFLYKPFACLGFFPGVFFALIPSAIHGFLLYSCTMPIHSGDEIQGESIPPEEVSGDWAEHQIGTTNDFAPFSTITTLLWDGVNNQVLHHLFPTIDGDHYPSIAPILHSTLKEYGIKHSIVPSWAILGMQYCYWFQKTDAEFQRSLINKTKNKLVENVRLQKELYKKTKTKIKKEFNEFKEIAHSPREVAQFQKRLSKEMYNKTKQNVHETVEFQKRVSKEIYNKSKQKFEENVEFQKQMYNKTKQKIEQGVEFQKQMYTKTKEKIKEISSCMSDDEGRELAESSKKVQ